MKSVVIWVVSGATAVAWGIAIGLWLAEQEPRQAPVPTTSTVTRESVSPRRVAPWRGRVARLEQRILELEGHIQATAAKPTPKPEATISKVIPSEEDFSSASFVARAEALQDFNIQKIESLTATLDDEPTDSDWAHSVAQEIEQTFDQQGFEGSALESTECRSTFCAIRATHVSAAARDDFRMFATAMPEMGAEFIFRATHDGELETYGYFVREGFDSADHPARERF